MEFSGTWRVMPDVRRVNHVLRWLFNFASDNHLDNDRFNRYFGKVMGDHYFSKWMYTYERDLVKMFGYFGDDNFEGQKFLDMLRDCADEHERRRQKMDKNKSIDRSL